ncbi:hypothetical protein BLNAU_16559 [Blattamonas nauphoetae]|uniref:Uncharacterized protein n=1 Tax=Blattamonas nauphoetae TaxID=2049346 RepID=A0ABQ9XE31_9EUKA|nr:hypothetical protein BLNAU_16559 [Blattamonas nauphoetae]
MSKERISSNSYPSQSSSPRSVASAIVSERTARTISPFPTHPLPLRTPLPLLSITFDSVSFLFFAPLSRARLKSSSVLSFRFFSSSSLSNTLRTRPSSFFSLLSPPSLPPLSLLPFALADTDLTIGAVRSFASPTPPLTPRLSTRSISLASTTHITSFSRFACSSFILSALSTFSKYLPNPFTRTCGDCGRVELTAGWKVHSLNSASSRCRFHSSISSLRRSLISPSFPSLRSGFLWITGRCVHSLLSFSSSLRFASSRAIFTSVPSDSSDTDFRTASRRDKPLICGVNACLSSPLPSTLHRFADPGRVLVGRRGVAFVRCGSKRDVDVSLFRSRSPSRSDSHNFI